MEIRPFPEPDLPESLKQLESKHWAALSTLHWRAEPINAEILACLEDHDLVQGTELTELGKLAQEHRHLFEEWDYENDGRIWKSCAVIATDGNGNDILLHAYGPAIDWHIGAYSSDVGELGLDGHTEPGVWVWEGTMGSVRHETMDGTDWDHEVTGDWRAPTEEEWELIRGGECPWDRETLPRWPKPKRPPSSFPSFDSLFKKEAT